MNANSGFNLNTVIETAKQVITDPVGFYRGMPRTGGFVEPVIFVLVMAVIAGLLLAVLSLIGLGAVGPSMATGFAAVIIYPIMAVIGTFIAGAILFVIWKLMGSGENYETAFRCIAFASAISPVTSVLSIIPYIGLIISVVWITWLMITASVEVHGRAKNAAMIVFGILGALALLWNLSAYRAAREMEDQLESLNLKQLEKLQEMKPEEAGKAVGEFLKGMEKGMQK